MDRKRKQGPGAIGAIAIAAVAVASASGALGCWDNRLPPREVPTEAKERALPRWYPEAPWSEKSGQTQIFIEGKIVFDTNKAIIRPGSEKVLKTALQFLNEHPEVTRFRIEGHTDARASEEHNMELSAQRALSVANWLVEQGVDPIRLIAVGFGESRPLGPNELEEGRSDNRRTEFHVAEVNGRPYGGPDPYNGGYAIEVLSLEERKRRAAEAAKKRMPPAPPQYKATGDEVKQVERKRSKSQDDDAAPQGGKPTPEGKPTAGPEKPAGGT
ncbi:MAG: OmpA family protein [Polyangiaceae bacterium]|nr:OmpA family protein [Polyangiaceae bacterium]